MTNREEYLNLISFAKARNHIKRRGDGFERHHILPKSLFPLWKDRKSNMVTLTHEEHIKAHRLLVDIYPTSQMVYALKFLTHEMPSEVMKEIAKERWQNKEYREKVRNSNLETWNNKNSDAWKNWKEGCKSFQEKRIKNLKNKICTEVELIETGEIFTSLEEAAKRVGLKGTSHISQCLSGKRTIAGKLEDGRKCHWKLHKESDRNIKKNITR